MTTTGPGEEARTTAKSPADGFGTRSDAADTARTTIGPVDARTEVTREDTTAAMTCGPGRTSGTRELPSDLH